MGSMNLRFIQSSRAAWFTLFFGLAIFLCAVLFLQGDSKAIAGDPAVSSEPDLKKSSDEKSPHFSPLSERGGRAIDRLLNKTIDLQMTNGRKIKKAVVVRIDRDPKTEMISRICLKNENDSETNVWDQGHL